jgi:hypothetical protein
VWRRKPLQQPGSSLGVNPEKRARGGRKAGANNHLRFIAVVLACRATGPDAIGLLFYSWAILVPATRHIFFKLGQPFFKRRDGVADRVGDLGQDARAGVGGVVGERCGDLFFGRFGNAPCDTPSAAGRRQPHQANQITSLCFLREER